MAYDPYSRTNQQALDGVIVGTAFYLACLIGYAGKIPFERVSIGGSSARTGGGPLNIKFFIWPAQGSMALYRLARCLPHRSILCGLFRLLLLAQIVLPAKTGIVRIPVNIIAVSCLLSLLGAVGIRVLRRIFTKFNPRGHTR